MPREISDCLRDLLNVPPKGDFKGAVGSQSSTALSIARVHCYIQRIKRTCTVERERGCSEQGHHPRRAHRGEGPKYVGGEAEKGSLWPKYRIWGNVEWARNEGTGQLQEAPQSWAEKLRLIWWAI